MKLFLFIISFLSFAHETQHLLSSDLIYKKGHYSDFLKSSGLYTNLANHNNRTTVDQFMTDMLANIRHDKEKEYNEWCGTPSKKFQTTCLGGCAVGSPVSWFVGWYTKYFLLTLTGSIGYAVFKTANRYSQLDVYEEVAIGWQKALIPNRIVLAKIMPQE